MAATWAATWWLDVSGTASSTSIALTRPPCARYTRARPNAALTHAWSVRHTSS